MSLTTNTPGHQQFTLLMRDTETKQQIICSHNGSAILTTDHEALIEYTRNLALHWGSKCIYTIAMVTDTTVFRSIAKVSCS